MRTFFVLSLFVYAVVCVTEEQQALRQHLSKLAKQDFGNPELGGLLDEFDDAMERGCNSCMMGYGADILGRYGGVLDMPPTSQYEKRQQEMMNVLMYYLYNEGYSTAPFPWPEAKCHESDPCNDHNPCTWDRCAWGRCIHLENPICETNPYTCMYRGANFCPFDNTCVHDCAKECPKYGFALDNNGGQCVMDCYYYGKSICNPDGDSAQTSFCVNQCQDCPLNNDKGGAIMNNWYSNVCFIDHKTKTKKTKTPESKPEGKCWDMGYYCERTGRYVDSCCGCPGAHFPVVHEHGGEEAKPCRCENRPGLWDAIRGQKETSFWSETLDFHYDKDELPCGVTALVPLDAGIAVNSGLWDGTSNLNNKHEEMFRGTPGNQNPYSGTATVIGSLAGAWNYKSTFDFFFGLSVIPQQLHGSNLGSGENIKTTSVNRAGDIQELYFFTDTDGTLCIGGPHYTLLPQYNVARVVGEVRIGHDTLFIVDSLLVPETCDARYNYDNTEHSLWGGMGQQEAGKFAIEFDCGATTLCQDDQQCGKGETCLSRPMGDVVDPTSIFARLNSANIDGGLGAFPGFLNQALTIGGDFDDLLREYVGDQEQRECTHFEEVGYGTSCLGVCQARKACYNLDQDACNMQDDCYWRSWFEGTGDVRQHVGCLPYNLGINPDGPEIPNRVINID